MTAITVGDAQPPVGEPSRLTQARWAVSDTLTITRRNLLVWFRVPAYIVFTVIQPVMFVLMFRYVFGGAIPVNVPGGYVNYLMPGIIGQTGVRELRHGHRLGTGVAEGRHRPAAVDADGALGCAG